MKRASLRAFYLFGSPGNTQLAICVIFGLLGLIVALLLSAPVDGTLPPIR
jgi:hypothetical protein